LLSVTLTAGIVAGIVRCLRPEKGRSLLFAAPLAAALVLVWNFPLAERSLLFFLPLFYAGLWTEGAHLAKMVRATLEGRRPLAERVLAAGLGCMVAAAAALAARHYTQDAREPLTATATLRAMVHPEKEEAYGWIRRNTNPDARFVAYEDANLYLHTGRQAMWLVALSNAAVYSRDARVMEDQLALLPDVARHIGARYWLLSEGDLYSAETDPEAIRERVAAWRRALPVVFRSRQRRVQIYDLGCVLEPDRDGCREVAAALTLEPEKRSASGPSRAPHPGL
jgi:hypothetical protein